MKALSSLSFCFAVSTIGLLSLCGMSADETHQKALTVRQVWARATPQGSKVGVAYLTIDMKKGSSDTLLSASTPAARKVEIHSHEEDKGILKMRHLEKLPIPEGQSMHFVPRGMHLMLIDLITPLKEGERLPLTLVFDKAGSIQVHAEIKALGALDPSSK